MSDLLPAQPRKPTPPSTKGETAARADAGTLIALFGMLVLGLGLLGLTALVLPQLLAIVIVVGGLFAAPIVFHYLVWGWWMSQVQQKDEGRKEGTP